MFHIVNNNFENTISFKNISTFKKNVLYLVKSIYKICFIFSIQILKISSIISYKNVLYMHKTCFIKTSHINLHFCLCYNFMLCYILTQVINSVKNVGPLYLIACKGLLLRYDYLRFIWVQLHLRWIENNIIYLYKAEWFTVGNVCSFNFNFLFNIEILLFETILVHFLNFFMQTWFWSTS